MFIYMVFMYTMYMRLVAIAMLSPVSVLLDVVFWGSGAVKEARIHGLALLAAGEHPRQRAQADLLLLLLTPLVVEVLHRLRRRDGGSEGEAGGARDRGMEKAGGNRLMSQSESNGATGRGSTMLKEPN